MFVHVKCFVVWILRGCSRCAGVWLCRRLLGVAAPPWVPDRSRGRRGTEVGEDGLGECRMWVIGGRLVGVAAPPVQCGYRVAPARREKGVWLCSGLVEVAAPPWVPDRGRGRRFGGMPGVGKGREVGGVAAPPIRPGGRPHPSAPSVTWLWAAWVDESEALPVGWGLKVSGVPTSTPHRGYRVTPGTMS